MNPTCHHCGSIDMEEDKCNHCGSTKDQKNWNSDVFKFSRKALEEYGIYEKVKSTT